MRNPIRTFLFAIPDAVSVWLRAVTACGSKNVFCTAIGVMAEKAEREGVALLPASAALKIAEMPPDREEEIGLNSYESITPSYSAMEDSSVRFAYHQSTCTAMN